MKKFNLAFIVLAVVLCLDIKLLPQTLDSLIAEGLQNNPMAASLKQKIKASEWRQQEVNNLPPPTVGIEFSQLPVGKFDLWNQPLSQNLSISQMFMLGGKLNAMSEMEKKNTKVAKNDLDIFKVNLTGQIKMGYYELWLIDRKIEIQQKTVDLLNNLLQTVESMSELKIANSIDILMTQNEISSAQAQSAILLNQRLAANTKLNKLIGRTLNGTAITTQKEFAIPFKQFNEEKLDSILSISNPSLIQMDNMTEMGKAEIDANRRELSPDLMLQGMIMRMPNGMILTSQSKPGMSENKADYMYSLMASITLPFAPWSAKKYSAKEESILAKIEGIRAEKTSMERDMKAKLSEEISRLNTSHELIKLYSEKLIPNLNDIKQLQINAYQNNKTNINSVIDSFKMLLMQQMNYEMAKADYMMALAGIEMMISEKIY